VSGLVGLRRAERNANAFIGGLIALGGDAADGDQNIGLRIVCGSAPAGNRIWNDGKAGCLAQLSFKVTVYVYDLTCGWRIVISPAAGYVTLLHSVAGLARTELLVADFKGIRAA
jgi:hypothetical protein